MPFCPECKSLLRKDRIESYCNKCGYVEDNPFIFEKVKMKHVKVYTSWKCNFKQTLNQTRINKGRVILKGCTQPMRRC